MKNKKRGLSLLLPACAAGAMALVLGMVSCDENKSPAAADAKSAAENSPIKVLYVTYENGRWHDTTAQRGIFTEIATANNWKVDMLTGTLEEVAKKLAETPNFGDGYDVIAYNFCYADCKDLRVPYNIIAQTTEKSIPSLLIHGSLHSYWDTYKGTAKDGTKVPGTQAHVYAKKGVYEKWTSENPDKAFPVWSNFTGISSTNHGPREAVEVKVIKKDHVLAAGVNDYTTTPVAELYNNYVSGKDSPKSTSIIKGIQGEESAIVLWEHPVADSKVISFSLGHSNDEWKQPDFQKVIVNSVNHLAELKRSAD